MSRAMTHGERDPEDLVGGRRDETPTDPGDRPVRQ